MTWTTSDIEILIREWPNHSASEIGRMLGKTKGQISGKANRMGLRKTVAERLRMIPRVLLTKGRHKMEDLGPHQCRWPYGDDLPFTYCGERVKRGTSWCEEHFAKLHQRKA